jgi:hypothetical protein
MITTPRPMPIQEPLKIELFNGKLSIGLPHIKQVVARSAAGVPQCRQRRWR